MAETTNDWWQDSERTSTTRRTPSGSDDSGDGYNLGPDSGNEDPPFSDGESDPSDVDPTYSEPGDNTSGSTGDRYNTSPDDPLSDEEEPGSDINDPPAEDDAEEEEADEESSDPNEEDLEASGGEHLDEPSDDSSLNDEIDDDESGTGSDEPDSAEDGEEYNTNSSGDIDGTGTPVNPEVNEETTPGDHGSVPEDGIDNGKDASDEDDSETSNDFGGDMNETDDASDAPGAIGAEQPLPSGIPPDPDEDITGAEQAKNAMNPDEANSLTDDNTGDPGSEDGAVSGEESESLGIDNEPEDLFDEESSTSGGAGFLDEEGADDFFSSSGMDMPDIEEAGSEMAGDITGIGGAMSIAQDVSSGRLNQGSFTANIKEAWSMGGDVAKEYAKTGVRQFVISHLPYIIGGILVFLLLGGLIFSSVVQTILSNQESMVEEQAVGMDFSNHRLTDKVLRFEDEASQAVKTHGLSEDWTYIVLGLIQQETGGNIESYPDVMQSSESQGLPMNTFTDPQTSIHYGVLALKNAIDNAESNGIQDLRAILQGYNMGHVFLGWMSNNSHSHWTSDIAENYSKTVVLPSLMGRSATESDKDPNNSPWATSIGKPYYWRNGGDFHYPNAIMHHLGVDYSGSGPILLEDVSNAVMAEGSLDGYVYPIPQGQFHITSEFGHRWGRLHAGIDMQYNGDKMHSNAQIFAAADGKVTQVMSHATAGNFIDIQHGPPGENDAGLDPDVPVKTRYLHLNSPGTVKVGQEVKAGDHIGYEGNTGGSSGDHLHFEIRQNGEAINPRQVYEFPPSIF